MFMLYTTVNSLWQHEKFRKQPSKLQQVARPKAHRKNIIDNLAWEDMVPTLHCYANMFDMIITLRSPIGDHVIVPAAQGPVPFEEVLLVMTNTQLELYLSVAQTSEARGLVDKAVTKDTGAAFTSPTIAVPVPSPLPNTHTIAITLPAPVPLPVVQPLPSAPVQQSTPVGSPLPTKSGTAPTSLSTMAADSLRTMTIKSTPKELFPSVLSQTTTTAPSIIITPMVTEPIVVPMVVEANVTINPPTVLAQPQRAAAASPATMPTLPAGAVIDTTPGNGQPTITTPYGPDGAEPIGNVKPPGLLLGARGEDQVSWSTSIILFELCCAIPEKLEDFLTHIEKVYYGYGLHHGFLARPTDDPSKCFTLNLEEVRLASKEKRNMGLPAGDRTSWTLLVQLTNADGSAHFVEVGNKAGMHPPIGDLPYRQNGARYFHVVQPLRGEQDMNILRNSERVLCIVSGSPNIYQTGGRYGSGMELTHIFLERARGHTLNMLDATDKDILVYGIDQPRYYTTRVTPGYRSFRVAVVLLLSTTDTNMEGVPRQDELASIAGGGGSSRTWIVAAGKSRGEATLNPFLAEFSPPSLPTLRQ